MSIKADINISPRPDPNTLSLTCKTNSPRFPPDTTITVLWTVIHVVEMQAFATLLLCLMISVLADILHSTHNGRHSLIETASIQAFFLHTLTCETHKFCIYTHGTLPYDNRRVLAAVNHARLTPNPPWKMLTSVSVPLPSSHSAYSVNQSRLWPKTRRLFSNKIHVLNKCKWGSRREGREPSLRDAF